MQKYIHLRPEGDFRCIIISDVHGHGKILERLLKKIEVKPDDYLIILGDFVNRGLDSWETYVYVKKLQKRPRTYVLKGNHELFIWRHLQNAKMANWLVDFMKHDYFETIVSSILKKDKVKIESLEKGQDLVDYFKKGYSQMLEDLDRLPILMDFDRYRFVHGGYDSRFDIEEEADKFLKYDNFDALAKPQERWTIVGHCPVVNLRKDEYSNKPYVNKEKKILSIDGGIGVTISGELNAVLLERQEGNYRCSSLQENGFKKARIRFKYAFPKEQTVFVNFPSYGVEILEKGPLFSRCKYLETGKEFSVFTCLLKRNHGLDYLRTNYINHFLDLEKGESVEVTETFEDCAFIKYKDKFGWVLRNQLDFI